MNGYQMKCVRRSIIIGSFWMLALPAYAQTQQTTLADAQKYVAAKQYDKALPLYATLYAQQPDDVYEAYLNTLLLAKKYKDAEKIVQARLNVPNHPIATEIDMGRVLKATGKTQKAAEQWDNAVQRVNGDDMLTQQIAKAFIAVELYEYAVQVYTRAEGITRNSYLYNPQIADMYVKMGQLDMAMDAMLAGPQSQYNNTETIKELFLQWMGSDAAKLQKAQKNLIKRINEQPENTFYVDLLTWIYTQKNDWEGALMQIEAVDERNKETGNRLLAFARMAVQARQYDVAARAYDDVIAKGDVSPLYNEARKEKLAAEFAKLKDNTEVKTEDALALLARYDVLFAENAQMYSTNAVGDYAKIAAQYADSVNKAIAILQRAVKTAGVSRQTAALLKLQMGDYYVLAGRIWDASLVYSQVDKDFRQDMFGEDARFRNARLAYYRGDFDWAQKQLSVLKASTSELIANDALYLSVLITENTKDSITYPLGRFAYADLLMFRNKDKDAEQLYDSLAKAFPEHSLKDDILMQHARLARKHQQYDKALAYLALIVKEYGQDVLGDDALFMMADIYQYNLHKNDEAKKYYEQLIIDFMGSTYVQTARRRIAEMANPEVNQ